MTAASSLDFLSAQLADCDTQWSIGAFGALAEFARDRDEAAEISRSSLDVSVVTSRGGIRISPNSELRLIASESVTRESWSHRVALCLPEASAAMARRGVLTELGPDPGALRDRDREATLFDLGLALYQVDACIRVSDPAVVAELRACTGRNVFEPGNPAMRIIVPAGPHRVFVGRLGRVEVFQPIPPPGGRSPEGPHTHVLPNLLQHQRTHAATEQIPTGWVPCAHFYPPHPAKDSLGHVQPFDAARHLRFQAMLEWFGNHDTVAIKRRLVAAVEQGEDPSTLSVPNDRFARAGVRVALRQLQAGQESSPTLAAWLHAYDRPHAIAVDIDDAEAMHAHA